MIMPRSHPSGSMSIVAFIPCMCFFCTSIGSFRISKKTGEWRVKSLSLFLFLQKSDRKLTDFFRYVRIMVTRIWIYLPLYQISALLKEPGPPLIWKGGPGCLCRFFRRFLAPKILNIFFLTFLKKMFQTNFHFFKKIFPCTQVPTSCKFLAF